MPDAQRLAGLVVIAGMRACAIPVGHVVETMRPVPIQAMAGAPPFVMGLAIVRGTLLPVVALAALLGVPDAAPPTRFVTLRVAERAVVLAVDAVDRVVALDRAMFEALPPLLRDAGTAVEAIAPVDGELLLVLRASRLLPKGGV